jgi:hypothetical protein
MISCLSIDRSLNYPFSLNYTTAWPDPPPYLFINFLFVCMIFCIPAIARCRLFAILHLRNICDVLVVIPDLHELDKTCNRLPTATKNIPGRRASKSPIAATGKSESVSTYPRQHGHLLDLTQSEYQ